MKDLTVPEDRALNAEERLLLVWLFKNGEALAQRFLPQLDQARVISRCGCGCPSIDLEVAASSSRISDAPQIVVDFVGATGDGLEVGGMVWTKDGLLSGLEIYSFEGHEQPFGLPTLGSLKHFPRDGSKLS